MIDYFREIFPAADHSAISSLYQEKQTWVNQQKKGFLRYRTPFQTLAKEFSAQQVDCTADTVVIGTESEVTSDQQNRIKEQLRSFMPWRKGPFSVFGIDIDAEWRSSHKWDFLLPELPDLRGKVIADIGCNNGYYMFRMAAHKPRFVLGFEPSVQHYYCFKALNGMAGLNNLDINLLGVEHLALFRESFDIIFLMGIIYHRPSPIDTLRHILTALKPGGVLLLETQAIPGEEPMALFPEKTYAKVPGTYFVPTASCLQNWVQKAGFRQGKVFAAHKMSPEIQRRTEWMTFESYSDYIDADDPTKTVEGYPAPLRLFVKALKRGIRKRRLPAQIEAGK